MMVLPQERALQQDAYRTPVEAEIEAFDLDVEGALPPELCGHYVRNGPNPRPGSQPAHLFLGDGMLHGVRIEAGKACWYRNRWVRTRAFVENARYASLFGKLDFTVGVANTNVIEHAGRMLTLVESSYPCEITADLATVGVYDFSGKLKSPFTAHPKRCPRTGELHAFGMQTYPGALTYLRIDASGELIESRRIPVKKPTMMHDFALTEHYAIFMDLPVLFDVKRVFMKEFPYRWSDRYGARLGIVSRNDAAAPVRWLEIAPCYIFHVLNAYEDGEQIVIDVVRYDELWRTSGADFGPTTLHRWTIDTANARVTETTLDDQPLEFPRCDERLTGSAHRYGYAVGEATIAKYDLRTGSVQRHAFASGQRPGEAVFVPAHEGAAEDAGWLMCFVYDAASDRSRFVVLDASAPEAKPVASVTLPQRVPFGFHGNWFPSH